MYTLKLFVDCCSTPAHVLLMPTALHGHCHHALFMRREMSAPGLPSDPFKEENLEIIFILDSSERSVRGIWIAFTWELILE